MNSLLAVVRFECLRILTPGRSVWWLLVAGFPMVITMLMSSLLPPPGSPGASTIRNADTVYTIVLYFLAPSISCMLGCLLTAAPSVASELEQHSWIYIATRPSGLFHLVIGKYLVAVLWATSATVAGVLLALPFSEIVGIWDAAWPLLTLSVLSACCYSALYMTIGTLFPQRAMVFCVAYTAGVELFLGLFPAVISRVTIQFRLRSLLFHWMPASQDIQDPQVSQVLREFIASDESVFLQLFWLLALAAVLLAVALTTVQVREFTTATESEV